MPGPFANSRNRSGLLSRLGGYRFHTSRGVWPRSVCDDAASIAAAGAAGEWRRPRLDHAAAIGIQRREAVAGYGEMAGAGRRAFLLDFQIGRRDRFLVRNCRPLLTVDGDTGWPARHVLARAG